MHFFQGEQESHGVTKVVIISIMIDFTCDINKAALTVDAFFQIYLIILIPLLHFFFVGGKNKDLTVKAERINSNQVALCSRSNQSGTNIKMKTACSEMIIIEK